MKLYQQHGSRLPGNLRKVCQRSNGQFIVTIPKREAERFGLENGSIVLIENRAFIGLVLEKVEVIKTDEGENARIE